MFKLKSLLIIYLLFIFILTSCSIKKEDANNFVENFVNSIESNNVEKTKQCLGNNEQKIIKIFKASDNNNTISNPTVYAYYYMAKGNFVIDKKEVAYNYYTKALESLNNVYKKQNVELEVMLLKERAKCSFDMRTEDKIEDIHIQNALNDIQKAINIKNNDWELFYLSGTIYNKTDNFEEYIAQLEKAKDLCEDTNKKDEIQQQIDIIKANIFVDNFINTIKNSNTTDIALYLEKNEDEIIKQFKLCNNDTDIVKNPEIYAYQYIAKGNYEINNFENAYKYYTKAIEIVNNEESSNTKLKIELLLNRAMCNFAMRKENKIEDAYVKKAFEDIQEAKNIDVNYCDSFDCSGEMYYVLGNIDKALEELEKAKKLCEDTNKKNEIQQQIDIIKANIFVDRFINTIENSNTTDIALYLEKNEEEIIEQFKFCNTDTNILKKPEFWAYFYLAIGNFKIEKFEIAYEYSTKVIENFENIDLKNETKAGIFYMRAFCLVNPIFSKSKDELDNNDIVNLKKADEDLKEAMKLDSDYDYFALAGRINYYLKDYKNSLQYFNKAIDLCDNKNEKNKIKKEMGLVQTIIEEATAFVKSFIEAVEANYLNTTEIEEYLNDEEKIIEMFNICNYTDIAKNPEVWAYFNIANGYYKIKEYETAYDCYTKAISLMEETQNQDDTLKSLLFQNRAWNIFIIRKSNDFEDENVKKAFEDIETAIRFNPEYFEIFVTQGFMYYQLSNKDMAIESFNKAKSICKNIKDKKEIQKHIDEINKEEEENIRMTEINNFIKNFIDAITNNDTNTIRSFLYEGENKIIEIFEASSFSDISKNPKAFAYYYIGIGYYRIGSYSLAIKYLTKAIEFIDSNIYSRIQSEIFLIRAICLSDNGKNVTEEAYNDILQAINYDNTYWYSHYLAGIMSMKLRNDKEIAFNHFVRAEDLCPNLEDKEYIQTLIKRLKDDHFWEELGEAANDGIEWVLDKAERILPIFSILD